MALALRWALVLMLAAVPPPPAAEGKEDVQQLKTGYAAGVGANNSSLSITANPINAMSTNQIDEEKSNDEGIVVVRSNDSATESQGEMLNAETRSAQSGRAASTDGAKCEPSHRCVDEEIGLVACLRVPGEDSSGFSLLIENRGLGILDIDILAPVSVNLEQTNIQLKTKEHKEFKVLIGDDANDSTIILKAGKAQCILNQRNTQVKRATQFSSYISYPIVGVVLLGVAILGAKLWRRHRQDGGGIYQKLNPGLPISSQGRKEADYQSYNWDSSWEDGWDDEEAPMTPSKPVPNPFARGLASRKSAKDGWKD